MALIDQLRQLAVILPPSFRALSGEAGDLLGAAIAHAEHGEALLEAAAAGPQAVADYFHQHISDNRPDDAPEPERGQLVENVQPTGQPAAPATVSKADFDRLTSLVEQLLAGQAAVPPTAHVESAGGQSPAPSTPNPGEAQN